MTSRFHGAKDVAAMLIDPVRVYRNVLHGDASRTDELKGVTAFTIAGKAELASPVGAVKRSNLSDLVRCYIVAPVQKAAGVSATICRDLFHGRSKAEKGL